MPATRKLEFDHLDRHLVGEVTVPEGAGPFPVVLVMSNAHGLGRQARASSALLADRGYIAVATDMYGHSVFHADPMKAGPDYAGLMEDRPTLRDRVNAGRDAAAALPEADPARVAAIGYCFGGACVLELARTGA